MWEDLFSKDFHQSEDIKLTQIKQDQVQPGPDQIETSTFKLQLAWNTLERMHCATKVTFSKPQVGITLKVKAAAILGPSASTWPPF